MSNPAHKPKGNPSKYSPKAEATFQRLWETTTLTHREIAAELLRLHGLEVHHDRLADHASKRGFVRPMPPKPAWRSPDRVMEIAALRRLGTPRAALEADRTARVPTGTHRVAGGFTMIGGHVRW